MHLSGRGLIPEESDSVGFTSRGSDSVGHAFKVSSSRVSASKVSAYRGLCLQGDSSSRWV